MGIFSSKYNKENAFLSKRSIGGEDVYSWDEPSLSRLRIVMRGDKTDNSKNEVIVSNITFDGEFDSFQTKYPGWRDEACVLFWRNKQIRR